MFWCRCSPRGDASVTGKMWWIINFVPIVWLRLAHSCTKRLYATRFYSGYVFTFSRFFCNFSTFFLLLTNVVKFEIWICKNPTKNTLRRCLSNDLYWLRVGFVDRNAKYVIYLLLLIDIKYYYWCLYISTCSLSCFISRHVTIPCLCIHTSTFREKNSSEQRLIKLQKCFIKIKKCAKKSRQFVLPFHKTDIYGAFKIRKQQISVMWYRPIEDVIKLAHFFVASKLLLFQISGRETLRTYICRSEVSNGHFGPRSEVSYDTSEVRT